MTLICLEQSVKNIGKIIREENIKLWAELMNKNINFILDYESMLTFPELIKNLRESFGFSREYIAERMGISSSSLKRLENGTFTSHGPDRSVVNKVAGYYDLDLNFINNKLDLYIDSKKPQKKYNVTRKK